MLYHASYLYTYIKYNQQIISNFNLSVYIPHVHYIYTYIKYNLLLIQTDIKNTYPSSRKFALPQRPVCNQTFTLNPPGIRKFLAV